MKKLVTVILLTTFTIGSSQTLQLDTTFGTNGFVSLPMNSDGNSFTINKLQSDGKIIVSGTRINGTISQDFIARYNQNGTIDNSFGVNGFYIFNDSINDSNGPSFLILSNDSILCIIENVVAEITKLNANGTIDDSFGTNGKINFQFFNSESPYLDANDNLFIGTGIGFELIKINTTSGTIDTSFGTNGTIQLENTQFNEIYSSKNNKFLVQSFDTNSSTSPTIYSYNICRFLSDGTKDISFGNNGILKLFSTFNFSDFDNLDFIVKVDPVNDVLFITENDFINGSSTIKKYDPNGNQIVAFGTSGVATLPTNNYISDTQLFNSKLYLSGVNEANTTFNTALLRYGINGTIDNTFNASGLYVENTNLLEEWSESMSITQTGNIIISGEYSNGNFNKMYLAKYIESNLNTTHFENDFIINYQNPLADKMEVTSNKAIASIALYNEVGKQIGYSNSSSMNVEQFAGGVYFAKIISFDNEVKVVKLIKI